MRQSMQRRSIQIGAAAGVIAAALVFGTGAAHAAPGDLDLTFGDNGVVVMDIGQQSTDGATSVSLAGDGSMLVAGSSNPSGVYQMTVVGLHEDGSLDTHFGDQGRMFVDNGDAAGSFASSIQRDAAGNIYLTGSEIDFNIYLLAADAFSPNGTPLFTPAGLRGLCDGDSCSGYAIARDASSGDLFFIGDADEGGGLYDFFIWKTGPDGNTAPNWVISGLYDSGDGSDDRAFAGALDGNGALYAAGYSYSFASASYDFAVLKIHAADGSVDTSFGENGFQRIDIGSSSDDAAYAMALDAAGNIYVAGTSNAGGPYQFTVIKLDSTGHLVAGFGSGGKEVTSLDGYAVGIGFDGRNKLYLAGTSANTSNDFSVIELDPTTGAPVESYGEGGHTSIDLHLGSNDQVYGMGVDGAGRVVVVGQTNSAGSNDFAVLRLQPNPADSVYAGSFDH